MARGCRISVRGSGARRGCVVTLVERRRRSIKERASILTYMLRALFRTPRMRPETALPYETLLTNLGHKADGGPRKIILITSTQPGEGKTTVAVNLAITGSRAGRKVLLVDCNLRHPSIHRILGLENRIGLVDLLVGRCDAEQTIQFVNIVGDREMQKSLGVIPSGAIASENILRLLGAPNVPVVLQALAQNYDLLLVDAPPVLNTSDAILMAPAVDGILFTIHAGTVEGKNALRAKEQLQRTNTPMLGAVLNRFDQRLHGSAGASFSNPHHIQS